MVWGFEVGLRVNPDPHFNHRLHVPTSALFIGSSHFVLASGSFYSAQSIVCLVVRLRLKGITLYLKCVDAVSTCLIMQKAKKIGQPTRLPKASAKRNRERNQSEGSAALEDKMTLAGRNTSVREGAGGNRF
ncbi:unnamed protein product [Mesocestoides corti]|uniref:Uncharacterized protein n=1 Tax=Mesocestoides corti TaxID=53468 RepID=A0A0R3UL95_MESCO|nr:unnamed protein product [Mesocestoides corti]